MELTRKNYQSVRPHMRPGDVIAFSGKGEFSEIIKWATRSQVSHVGVVLQSKMIIEGDPQAGFFNQVIESANINGFSGVSISRLSDRIATYDGDIWWLPLSDASRARLNFKKFYDFLLHQDRKPYDLPQAVTSALDLLDRAPVLGRSTLNGEDFARFFCSELVAAGLEAGGVIRNINSAEVTPIDLCMFNIFSGQYYHMKPEEAPKQITGYNTVDPEGFGM